jgi:hypothetical protein
VSPSVELVAPVSEEVVVKDPFIEEDVKKMQQKMLKHIVSNFFFMCAPLAVAFQGERDGELGSREATPTGEVR